MISGCKRPTVLKQTSLIAVTRRARTAASGRKWVLRAKQKKCGLFVSDVCAPLMSGVSDLCLMDDFSSELSEGCWNVGWQ